ncbi:MAG: methyltransferase domain-containing protein [Gemmataceae bacterium]|nr:methyltransferase domain-containing protein [Gemmataceae bacterium]
MLRTITLIAIVAISFSLAFGQDDSKVPCRIIYVPTEQVVVEKMLEMAKVKKDDDVFDLGCGDGRIVVTAAKKFGAKGVGIDIDPARIKDSLATMRKAGIKADLVDIRQGDALTVKDLERASVIMLYMLPEFMEKLEPQLKARLKPGTRIVAHDYPFPNMEPDQVVEFETGGSRPKFLYMRTVREAKKK